MMFLLKGAFAFAFGFLVIYGLWCLLARRRLSFDARTVWLYMGCAFPVCVLGEVSIGHLHAALFGTQLWQYRIAPTHDGYTSLYNFAIWPLFGWHVYLSEKALALWNPRPALRRSALFLKHASGGPLLEIVANLAVLLVMGRYYFYYFPDDLWHLTSVQVVPYYAVPSFLFSCLIAGIREIRHKITVGSAAYAAGLVYLFMA